MGANGVATALTLQHVRRMSQGADVIKASRGLDAVEANTLLAQLRADPAVQFAELDLMMQALDFIPNDTNYAALQWHYFHAVGGIGMPKAWDASRGAGVKVAVLDTGYVDHSDLNANIVPGYDFIADAAISGDGDALRDADAHDPGDWFPPSKPTSSFHGTHVAGTIAAVTNNALGLAGVAFDAKVQPVRVLGHGGGFTSDIADAITWASGGTVAGVPDNTDPAEVLNLSLGGSGSCLSTSVTQLAINGAIARGVTVVVAAGNENTDAASKTPASCAGVITVGATGVDRAKSYFSNYGNNVTLSAPGGNATSGTDPNDRWIWSLGNKGTTTPIAGPDGEALVGMIGTSMASPHVAAVVALMQSAAVAAGQPALTPTQMRYVLRKNARPFAVAPPTNTPIGAGVVDAAKSVAAAQLPVPLDPGTLLTNRVPMNNQFGAVGEGLLYEIAVPAGMLSLNLRSYGGNGDVSLYVSRGTAPTTTVFERKSAKAGNSETVVYNNPQAGTYYVRIVGEKAFSGVSVLAVYQ